MGPQQPPKGAQLVWQFCDGCGNNFSMYSLSNMLGLNNYLLIYDAISPMESCSGTYSGGTSYQKQLSPNEFQILDDAFEEMRKNTHDHCNGRFKGTGVFIKGQIKFMMRMGAFTQFETLIRTHNIDSPHHVNDY
ncbi:hypothetical protein FDP41_008471 [Naegleria fowleri]|uniref:Uncharacterized protein n=1 Tax=Naegleria fowleri TaxID=5763 RepID=A0A6A5BGW6_NAEFO|nr:uncharacterized protein FDP41_008471 [Naegleria fowleri]KAF0973264.1 hypothetical protein FDP41_008471 [Naegleria fowleri]CAG4715307.1 unnamed protein product [Naegleria fowleri]